MVSRPGSWLVSGALLAACSSSSPPTPGSTAPAPVASVPDPAVVPPGPAAPTLAPAPRTPDQEAPLLDAAIVTACLEADGRLAIVRIDAAEVSLQGTRGERVVFRGQLLATIRGPSADPVEFWRYTKGGDPILAVGTTHVVALEPARGLTLLGHLAIATGDVERSAAAHRQLVASLARGR